MFSWDFVLRILVDDAKITFKHSDQLLEETEQVLKYNKVLTGLLIMTSDLNSPIISHLLNKGSYSLKHVWKV
jgi:hypothetical protein